MSNSRIGLLLFIFLVLTLGLSWKLFYISGTKHNYYVAQAEQQQSVERDILPKRGDIYAQDGIDGKTSLIATSIETFAISATPKNVTKKEDYATAVAKATGVDVKEILADFQTNSLYMNPIKHGLTKEDVQQLANDLNAIEAVGHPTYEPVKLNFDAIQGNIIYFIGGIFFIREYQRVYPESALMGQTLGFVDNSGQGRYGFEQQYNKQLAGFPGKLLLEQDSVGNLLNQNQVINGQDGDSYELSLDRNIQYEVEKELADEVKLSEAQSGSVIIMNPKTGEIVAMAATPSYDPNKFSEITSAQIGLFDNPVISQIWEPGSIFKPLVMSGAIDLGLVTPDTKGTYGATVTVDGHVINTALRKSFGEETMTQVLENSDNVAMVSVAEKLGNKNMYDYLSRYGFGKYTNIDLANEIAGNVLPLDQWKNIDRATMSFGQGIAVTPIQMISAFSAIANNGQMIQPRMVHAIIHPDGTKELVKTAEGSQVIKPETAKELRDMMVATVVYAHNRAGTEGYKIGGKTGTAQIPDPKNGGYLSDAYNHSFVGIGPSDDPKYVMLIKIDHPNLQKVGLYAEGTAVPLFGRLSTFLLNYYQIPPTNR